MNWKNWVPFVLALACGLIAAGISRRVLSRPPGVTAAGPGLARVVVASADLRPGEMLTPANIVIGGVAPESLPRSAYVSTQEIVGLAVVSPVEKGQVIVPTMLAPVGSGVGVQALVPAGMRACTLEINEFSGIAGLIVPGARVDVLSTLFSDGKSNQPIATTVVQNAHVIAVGQRLDATGADAPNGADKPGAPPSRSVTLLVSPREAEILELVSSAGRTRLALRGRLDTATVQTGSGVSVVSLTGRTAGDDDSHKPPLGKTPDGATGAPTPTPVAPRLPEPPITPAPGAVAVKPETQKRAVEVINGSSVTIIEYEVVPQGPGSTAITDTESEHKPIGGGQ